MLYITLEFLGTTGLADDKISLTFHKVSRQLLLCIQAFLLELAVVSMSMTNCEPQEATAYPGSELEVFDWQAAGQSLKCRRQAILSDAVMLCPSLPTELCHAQEILCREVLDLSALCQQR